MRNCKYCYWYKDGSCHHPYLDYKSEYVNPDMNCEVYYNRDWSDKEPKFDK